MEPIIDITDIEYRRCPVNIIIPSKEEQKLFENSMSYLVFKWSMFSQMIYSGMEMIFTDSVPIAATDSRLIFLNPAGFLASGISTIPQVVFVHAHEVGHRFFNDLVLMQMYEKIGKVGDLPYHAELYNIAADFRINAMLKSSGIGEMPACALYDPVISRDGTESVVDIYAQVFKNARTRPGGGYGYSGKGFDKHLRASDETITKDKGKREQEIVAASQVAARTQGHVPAALQRIIDDIVDPRIPWEDHLKSTMQRKAGDPKLDWRYTNRRLAGRDPSLYYAKRGHKGCGLVVIAADNSGSIGQREVSVFSSEMAGILADLNPAEVVIYWCDAAITKTYRISDIDELHSLFREWKTSGVGGGGGTSFVPVFEAVKELDEEPDMLVYFTDMYGTFPSVEPSYDTIWASISGSQMKAPFGELVEVVIK